MFRMTQRETAFFDVFEAAARIAHESAMLLEELVVSFENPDEKIKALEVKEREGDQQVHAMMDRLNRSFITPMDREDLFHISKELDDITDCIETTAHLFAMFDVRIVKPEAVAFVKLIVEATAELRGVILEMKSFKKNRALKTKVIEINRLENEGDQLHRRAVHALFTQEKDAIEVLKWREVYENLECALDACEHVANVILGAVVKHA